MLYHLFLLTVLFTVSECWVLKASKHIVSSKITTNVSLECVYDGNDNGLQKLNDVNGIKIVKYINDLKWDTIAKLSSIQPLITSSLIKPEYVKGSLGTVSNSYLKIDFPIATTQTIGVFMCQISNYVHEVQTYPIVIKERAVTSDDILDIIDDMKKNSINSLQTKVKSIVKDIVKNSNDMKCGKCEPQVETSTKLTNQINNVSKDFLELKEELAKQMKMIEDNKLILKNDPSKVWPTGTYDILKPKSGCPYSPFFDWANGSIKISTDRRVSNTNKISVPSHMAGTVLQHDDLTGYNSVNMELCAKRIQDQGPAWPAGHYCIQTYDGKPTEVFDFNFGYIQFDRYDTAYNDFATNTWSYLTNNLARIGFWCRQDGDATTPIVLPSKDPFYLYRFGGKCQNVKGMNVTDEWVTFDTMGPDGYENNWHPDCTLKPVNIQLCYYTPRL